MRAREDGRDVGAAAGACSFLCFPGRTCEGRRADRREGSESSKHLGRQGKGAGCRERVGEGGRLWWRWEKLKQLNRGGGLG